MNIVIVGAGTIGYYLTRSLLGGKHDIKLIEPSKTRCMIAADKLEVTVIHGDGTQIGILKKAGTDKADVLVAVTGNDENNFVCAQLAKQHFGVKRTIARANNPQNIEAMKTIAADIVVSSADIISNIIEQEVDSVGMRLVTRLSMGDSSVLEFIVDQDDPIEGKNLSEIELPKDTLIITIMRKGKSIIPSGETKLVCGDNVMIVTREQNKKSLQKLFGRSLLHH